MKRTIKESEIRQIIREALCELGGGDMNSIDSELRKYNAELVRFYCDFDGNGQPTTLCVRIPYDQFSGALDEYMSDTYGLNRYTVTAGSRGFKILWYRNDVQKPINERIVQWDYKLQDLAYALKSDPTLRDMDVKLDPNAGNYDPNYKGPKRLEVLYMADPNMRIRKTVEDKIKGIMMRAGYEVDPRVFGSGRSGYGRLGFKTQEMDRRSFTLRHGNIAESVDRIVKESINYVLNETDVYAQQDQYEISLFLQGLQQGRGEAMEDSVWVRYPDEETNENDPRYICYDFDNPGYLRDDHYSRQHIPLGTSKREVRNAIENNLGIRLPDDPADYAEEY